MHKFIEFHDSRTVQNITSTSILSFNFNFIIPIEFRNYKVVDPDLRNFIVIETDFSQFSQIVLYMVSLLRNLATVTVFFFINIELDD